MEINYSSEIISRTIVATSSLAMLFSPPWGISQEESDIQRADISEIEAEIRDEWPGHSRSFSSFAKLPMLLQPSFRR